MLRPTSTQVALHRLPRLHHGRLERKHFVGNRRGSAHANLVSRAGGIFERSRSVRPRWSGERAGESGIRIGSAPPRYMENDLDGAQALLSLGGTASEDRPTHVRPTVESAREGRAKRSQIDIGEDPFERQSAFLPPRNPLYVFFGQAEECNQLLTN